MDINVRHLYQTRYGHCVYLFEKRDGHFIGRLWYSVDDSCSCCFCWPPSGQYRDVNPEVIENWMDIVGPWIGQIPADIHGWRAP